MGADAEIRFIGDLAVGNFIPEPVAAPDWLRDMTFDLLLPRQR